MINQRGKSLGSSRPGNGYSATSRSRPGSRRPAGRGSQVMGNRPKPRPPLGRVNVTDMSAANELMRDFSMQRAGLRSEAAGLPMMFKPRLEQLHQGFKTGVWDTNAQLGASGLLQSGARDTRLGELMGQRDNDIRDLDQQYGIGRLGQLQAQEEALRSEALRQLISLIGSGASSMMGGS